MIGRIGSHGNAAELTARHQPGGATARADELGGAEIVAGGRRLRALVAEHRSRRLAVVGVTAYRTAFDRPAAVVGRQEDGVWALPNPSGLNAHRPVDAMVQEFARPRAESGA